MWKKLMNIFENILSFVVVVGEGGGEGGGGVH
jgi:hypothetical protein